MKKTDAEWKEDPDPRAVPGAAEKGTERPFTGQYAHSKDEGTYLCAACANPLFSSETKFDSGTGWPSFWEPIAGDAVETEEDRSLWMARTEVVCGKCGGHLGHVFDDGPEPTGQALLHEFRRPEARPGEVTTMPAAGHVSPETPRFA